MRITLIVAIVLLASCTPKISPMQFQRTGEVNAVSHENSIVTVRSQARAETVSKAVYFAERNALKIYCLKEYQIQIKNHH